MIIEFNVTTLFDSIPVNSEVKFYYEKIIQMIVEKQFDFLDTSKVERIVIPDDFIKDVIKYQEFLNIKNPSITNNEFGRAYGKIIFNQNTEKYIVFIDSNYAVLLMTDDFFESSFKNIDKVNRSSLHLIRQKAFNLLAHELAHVEFATFSIRPEYKLCLEDQVKSLVYQLFDEYYACRRSVEVSTNYIVPYDENYIIDIERKINDVKWEYKKYKIGLNEFCRIFHDLSSQSLIGMVSVFGEMEQNKDISTFYKNCKLNTIVKDFKVCFDNLYITFLEKRSIVLPQILTQCIIKYYSSFGVYITEQSEGLYYNITDE